MRWGFFGSSIRDVDSLLAGHPWLGVCVAGRHPVVQGLFWSISCYTCYLGIVAWVWLSLVCSFNRWVASYLYYRCDVSCGVRCVVVTVLCGVPSVVVVVSLFYCRRVGYDVLVVGGVSWALCWVLCRACPVWESASHCTVVGILGRIGDRFAAHAHSIGFTL